MTKLRIKKLVWDKWNTEHIKKHNVTVEEIEVATQNIIAHEKVKNGRYAAFARTGTRILTIIVKRQNTAIYYLVTARDADKPERRKVYEKEKK